MHTTPKAPTRTLRHADEEHDADVELTREALDMFTMIPDEHTEDAWDDVAFMWDDMTLDEPWTVTLSVDGFEGSFEVYAGQSQDDIAEQASDLLESFDPKALFETATRLDGSVYDTAASCLEAKESFVSVLPDVRAVADDDLLGDDPRQVLDQLSSDIPGFDYELDSLGECVMVLSPDDAESEARIVIPGLFAQDEEGTREYLCSALIDAIEDWDPESVFAHLEPSAGPSVYETALAAMQAADDAAEVARAL